MSQVSIFRSQKPICWERYFDTRQMLLMIQKNSFVFLLYDIVCFQVIFILLVFNVFIASLSTNMSRKRCSRRVENNCLFQHSFIIFFEISFGHNQMHSKQEKVERIDKTLDFFEKFFIIFFLYFEYVWYYDEAKNNKLWSLNYNQLLEYSNSVFILKIFRIFSYSYWVIKM